MAEGKPTIKREIGPTVMVVGAKGEPPYVAALAADGYELVSATDAREARAAMGIVMPHVVLMSKSVPMVDHRVVHDGALGVGASVMLTPDDAHPELVRAEVETRVERVKKRRAGR